MNKEIKYDRETRDYAMYLDGELVGFARTYHEAEVALDQTVFELLSAGHFATATELDGGATCVTCGNDGDCPDCDPSPGADEMAYQMLARATVLLNDCNRVITMALGQTNGAASVVGELRRVKEELDAAFA